MEQYMQYWADHGIPEEPIRYMPHDIPAKLLGLRIILTGRRKELIMGQRLTPADHK